MSEIPINYVIHSMENGRPVTRTVKGDFIELRKWYQQSEAKMNTKREQVEEQLKEENPEALFADGFDDAIIGISRHFSKPALVAYNRQKVIEILMERDGMEEDEAIEFFEFNIIGAWLGAGTPVFLDVYEDEEENGIGK